MAKQDVLDAINATIVENGTKAITAQSLNNVLTMMTENAGEGGSGALRIIVPELIMFGSNMLAIGEFTPASWATLKSEMEASNGLDLSEYEEVVNASFAHNANVAQQIIEKGKAGQGVSVVLDQTPYSTAAINVMLQVDPEMAEIVEESAIYAVQPAGLYMQYFKATLENEPVEFVCTIAPTGNIYLAGMNATYPSNMLIFLNLDGSLTFTEIEEEQPSSGSGVVTFTILTANGEQTSAAKGMNANAYRAYTQDCLVNIDGASSNGNRATYQACSHYANNNKINVEIIVNDFGTIKLKTYSFDSDGSYTLQQ